MRWLKGEWGQTRQSCVRGEIWGSLQREGGHVPVYRMAADGFVDDDLPSGVADGDGEVSLGDPPGLERVAEARVGPSGLGHDYNAAGPLIQPVNDTRTQPFWIQRVRFKGAMVVPPPMLAAVEDVIGHGVH
mmetsp:Transcript_29463/g.67757  ORF Transcript_29463/g.67757 Transcript_29463/m.67757 type:complete len:131 (-) Transcript_29463:1018-1410(-)